MQSNFDPYHKWLGIPPQHQPPTYYRLLGLELFEADAEVIQAAADRQVAHLQTYKLGPHSDYSQQLLNEVSRAAVCLLNPQEKSAYDKKLANTTVQRLASDRDDSPVFASAIAAKQVRPSNRHGQAIVVASVISAIIIIVVFYAISNVEPQDPGGMVQVDASSDAATSAEQTLPTPNTEPISGNSGPSGRQPGIPSVSEDTSHSTGPSDAPESKTAVGQVLDQETMPTVEETTALDEEASKPESESPFEQVAENPFEEITDNPFEVVPADAATDSAPETSDNTTTAVSDVVYLTNLQEEMATGWEYQGIKDWDFGKNGQIWDGGKWNPIVLAGKPSPHGLANHPPPNGYGVIQYRIGHLHKQTLEATVGVPDLRQYGPHTPLIFQVVGDKKILWQSRPVKRWGIPQRCRVKIAGVDLLELKVRCPGDASFAFAVWCEPRLTGDDAGDANVPKSSTDKRDDAKGEVPLFNGRDLTGWTVANSTTGKASNPRWKVEPNNRTLVAPGVAGNLLQSKEEFQDFTLTFEWQFPQGTRHSPEGSGVMIRAIGEYPSTHAPAGIEINLSRDRSGEFICYGMPLSSERGKVTGGVGKLEPLTEVLVEDGQWNSCEIKCQSDWIGVSINGHLVNVGIGAPVSFGTICLRDEGTVVEFRNIRLHRLQPFGQD